MRMTYVSYRCGIVQCDQHDRQRRPQDRAGRSEGQPSRHPAVNREGRASGEVVGLPRVEEMARPGGEEHQVHVLVEPGMLRDLALVWMPEEGIFSRPPPAATQFADTF